MKLAGFNKPKFRISHYYWVRIDIRAKIKRGWKFFLYIWTYRLIPAHFLEDFGVVVHPDRDDPVVVVGPLLVQILYPGYVPVEMRGAGTRQHLYRAPTLPHLYRIVSHNVFLKQKLVYQYSCTNNINFVTRTATWYVMYFDFLIYCVRY